MRQVISAGGIISKIIDNNLYILFVTARNGLLSFPKGHVEERESLEATAIREIKEEIGLKNVSIISKPGSVTRQGTEHDGGISNKTVHLFLTQAAEYTYDHEDDFVWIEFNQAIPIMRFKEEADFLLEHENIIRNNPSPYFSQLDIINHRVNDEFNFLNNNTINDDTNLSQQSLKYIKSNDIVFMVGLGSSFDALLFAKEKQATIYGVDTSKLVIENLSKKFVAEDLMDNLKIVCKDSGDIIKSDLPSVINVFYARFSLNLSNTKTFFLINEVLKKMPVGGYIIIEGMTKNDDTVIDGLSIGPNMIKTQSEFHYRLWDGEFVEREIIEKLHLKLIKMEYESFLYNEKNRELIYFIAQKETDYVY